MPSWKLPSPSAMPLVVVVVVVVVVVLSSTYGCRDNVQENRDEEEEGGKRLENLPALMVEYHHFLVLFELFF